MKRFLLLGLIMLCICCTVFVSCNEQQDDTVVYDETEGSVDSDYQTDAEENSESDNTDESEEDVEDTTDTEKSNDSSESTTENIYDDRWTGNY